MRTAPLSRLVVLFAVVMILTGCGPDLTQPPEADQLSAATAELKATRGARRPAAPSYALKTTDANVAGATPVWKTSFPVSSTYDVFLATEITGALSGHHTATIYVLMPNGSVYQRFDVAFATDVAANTSEQQAEKTAGGWRVWVSMPVAGTMIQQMNLVGQWSAQTWVDTATKANATATFRLL